MRLRIYCLIVILAASVSPAFGREAAQKALTGEDNLSNSLLADSASGGCVNFERLKNDYFKERRYLQFYDFLNALKDRGENTRAQPCIDYYKALASYEQLKYLEEKQSWDEYFAKGNTYRQQITENAQRAAQEATVAGEYLILKSRLLLWQFHRGQQDAFHEQALDELMDSVKTCAPAVKDPQLIKDIGDGLSFGGEKLKAGQVYKIYADKLISSGVKDEELEKTAGNFYREGNLELAQQLYDIYMDRISISWTKDKLVPELLRIARIFAYKPQGLSDAAYAETVFKRVDAQADKGVFGKELLYLRAFNLEKAKDFKEAAILYRRLVELYPGSEHYEEATYKTGLIEAYALADPEAAKKSFEKLDKQKKVSAYAISSLYQRGLLAQYAADLSGAKELYSRLLKMAEAGFGETVSLAKKRLNEIEENKPLEYNLKIFLDLALNAQGKSPALNKSEFEPSNYLPGKEEKIKVAANAYLPESGCLQVEAQYLWSGNTGNAHPAATENNFQTSYSDAGTKELNLVIVYASGALERSFDILDVR